MDLSEEMTCYSEPTFNFRASTPITFDNECCLSDYFDSSSDDDNPKDGIPKNSLNSSLTTYKEIETKEILEENKEGKNLQDMQRIVSLLGIDISSDVSLQIQNTPKLPLEIGISKFSDFDSNDEIFGQETDNLTSISDDDSEIVKKLDLYEDFFELPSINEIIAEMPPNHPMLLSVKFYKLLNQDPDATIEPMLLSANFDSALIYIAEIFDPAHIYCHFAYPSDDPMKRNIKENFDVFQKNINEEYTKEVMNEITIPKEGVKIGLIVATFLKNFNCWYRTKILEYNSHTDMIKIFCVDYGTKGFVKRKYVRYLLQKYIEFPSYCFRGRVHGVKPPENIRYFDPQNVETFITEVSGKTFNASCLRHDKEEDVYEMKLRRCGDGLDLKKYIIDKNFGTEIRENEYDSNICLGPMCYLIPSFEMLENDYPTYAELHSMQMKECNFNLAIDTNFFSCVSKKDVENDAELRMTLCHKRFEKRFEQVFGEKSKINS